MAKYEAKRTVYVHTKSGNLGAGRRQRFEKGEIVDADPDAHATKALVEDGSLEPAGTLSAPAPTRRRRARSEEDGG